MDSGTDNSKGIQSTLTSTDVENAEKNVQSNESSTGVLGGDVDTTKWDTMTWDTQNESYGNFYPEWPRTYMVRPHSPPLGANIRNKENTTSHEYGNWFQTPQGAERGMHPYARYTVPFERRMATPRTPQPISGSLLPPIGNPPKMPVSEQGFSIGPKLNLPDVKAVDVQFLTSQNTLVSIAPTATGVYKYTYPKGIHNVALPDIKEVNLKFMMRNNKTITMRAKPQLDDNE